MKRNPRKVEPATYRLNQNPYLVKSLDISTGHLTAKENELLNEAASGEGPFTDPLESPNNNPVIAYKYEYGHLVCVPTADKPDYLVYAEYGYSMQFINILKRAKELECKYVQFDGDGIQYDDLETFSW